MRTMRMIISSAVLAVAICAFGNGARAENLGYIIWADLWYWPTCQPTDHVSGDLKAPTSDCYPRYRHAAAENKAPAKAKNVAQ